MAFMKASRMPAWTRENLDETRAKLQRTLTRNRDAVEWHQEMGRPSDAHGDTHGYAHANAWMEGRPTAWSEAPPTAWSKAPVTPPSIVRA